MAIDENSVLRPDHQDYQGTAVTLEVARRLNVPDLFLVVNYNTSREWLGYARIPAGETFLGGYYDAGGSTDPVNVMLFPDTTDADHFFFLGDIPAGRQITEPRSSEADLRAAFQVNSGLVLINCCNGATQFPNGAEVLMLESAQ